MIKKIIFIAGMIFSASVFAQAENFAGTSVGINAGFNNQTLRYADKINLTNNNTNASLNATYTFALSKSATFGLGITYDLAANDLISASDIGNLDDSLTSSYQLKSHYSVNFEPGYAISDNTLGYFKVAYHSGKAYQSEASVDNTITGTGYGFGTKVLIDKNLYLNIDIEKVTYNSFTASDTQWKVTSTIATIGIGYKF